MSSQPFLPALPRNLTIIETFDPETNKPKDVTFYLIYPEVLKDAALTIAPDTLDDAWPFIKRPGVTCYETMKGTQYVPREILDETLIMEQLSKTPHPNIIRYLGCRVQRNHITAICLKRLDQTLAQYAQTPAFSQLDKTKFFAGIKSAIDHVHSLGLAHNDINPGNIMVKNGMPVLIDFGSCAPFGKNMQSLGTDGWYEELFWTSEKKHDEYSLAKLHVQEWLHSPM
ncbi:kinase-like domain-containing protein [Xylariaceae sp. FL0255]|nr:kinase-like domain-containing protein [Xylariaceae sp. FL0255]